MATPRTRCGESAANAWVARLAPLAAAGIDVYCYFKHEDEPRAPRYAERLLELVSRKGSADPGRPV